MKKLHLGCGQRYFEGYVNIDYPLSEHSVQQTSVADEYHDLLSLRYPAGSIDEVRLHHVFEHFQRAAACALLASWNSWLRQGGILHIEVPDFGRTARAVLSRWSNETAKGVGLRHIFGSQEAHWAVHYEGYTDKTLPRLLNAFGFTVDKVVQERYKDTYNLTVIASRSRKLIAQEAAKAAREHLRWSMVDDSPSENVLLGHWMGIFEEQLAKTRAVD
jgi:predicted SAM-dependent methyltransferase